MTRLRFRILACGPQRSMSSFEPDACFPSRLLHQIFLAYPAAAGFLHDDSRACRCRRNDVVKPASKEERAIHQYLRGRSVCLQRREKGAGGDFEGSAFGPQHATSPAFEPRSFPQRSPPLYHQSSRSDAGRACLQQHGVFVRFQANVMVVVNYRHSALQDHLSCRIRRALQQDGLHSTP